jgi:hypothetical protein
MDFILGLHHDQRISASHVQLRSRSQVQRLSRRHLQHHPEDGILSQKSSSKIFQYRFIRHFKNFDRRIRIRNLYR